MNVFVLIKKSQSKINVIHWNRNIRFTTKRGANNKPLIAKSQGSFGTN